MDIVLIIISLVIFILVCATFLFQMRENQTAAVYSQMITLFFITVLLIYLFVSEFSNIFNGGI